MTDKSSSPSATSHAEEFAMTEKFVGRGRLSLAQRIENMFSFLYKAPEGDLCHFDKAFLDQVKTAAIRGASVAERCGHGVWKADHCWACNPGKQDCEKPSGTIPSETRPSHPCPNGEACIDTFACERSGKCERTAVSATRFSVMEHVKGLGKGALKEFEYELCAALDYCRRNKP